MFARTCRFDPDLGYRLDIDVFAAQTGSGERAALLRREGSMHCHDADRERDCGNRDRNCPIRDRQSVPTVAQRSQDSGPPQAEVVGVGFRGSVVIHAATVVGSDGFVE